MEDYIQQVSGWLKASGNSLVDYLPAGSGICREVAVEPAKYWTGYVSTAEGSFKIPGESGNWYGTSFLVSDAENPATGTKFHEYSRLNQDTPVWNMYKLPEPFLAAIVADANIQSGKFAKSQFVVECLQILNGASGVSGVYFPSRRIDGGVIVLNPQAVSTTIVYIGQALPSY
jgi:hypothetical protein